MVKAIIFGISLLAIFSELIYRHYKLKTNIDHRNKISLSILVIYLLLYMFLWDGNNDESFYIIGCAVYIIICNIDSMINRAKNGDIDDETYDVEFEENLFENTKEIMVENRSYGIVPICIWIAVILIFTACLEWYNVILVIVGLSVVIFFVLLLFNKKMYFNDQGIQIKKYGIVKKYKIEDLNFVDCSAKAGSMEIIVMHGKRKVFILNILTTNVGLALAWMRKNNIKMNKLN